MFNFKILKNGFCVILCLCVVLSLSCCAKSGEGLQLNGVVEKILTENGIEKSKITFLCESSEKISELYFYTEPEISTEELTIFVDKLLLSGNEVSGSAEINRDVLDYYGCDTEADFLNECKIRLEQIKKYEALNAAYDDFLEKISEKCKFYIDKDEAADYSKKIVEDYKNSAYLLNLSLEEFIEQKLNITEDDFYDRCYDEGVAEIKRYLLVGASTADVDINAVVDFAEYCSLNGYDAADTDNTSGKYYYLKRITVLNNRPDVKFTVTAEAYVPYFEEGCEYTVDIYDTSNIYSVNLKSDTKRDLSGDVQDRIIAQLKETSFGGSQYNANNQLYQTVLVVKKDGKVTEKIYVDTLNGYLKWQPRNEKTVICKLTPEFEDLIKNSN